MINKVIMEAEKWIGYLEKKSDSQLESFTANAGNNNYTIFAKKYKEYFGENYQGQPWCAMFVSCVMREALGSNEQSSLMPHFSYCPYGVNSFKKRGEWRTSNPNKGDIIFFKNSSNVACHVGIVYNVDNTYVYTIEGNTSSTLGVVANGGAVVKKKYKLTYGQIMGYGRPKYQVLQVAWQKEFLDKLINKGVLTDVDYWSQYNNPVTKATCVALMDKVTGGIWTSNEADSNIHWAQPHIISLCGKRIIENPEEWIGSLDSYISKALLLAIVDKATNGVVEKYKNQTYSHWAIANVNSLCDKEIIDTPEAWIDDLEAQVDRGKYMALICKAFNI